jgi:prepilin-type N-terminal cleavage/methylation domain-containing protein/prepilin-type processing-associated H-X9-DG protein
VNAATSSDRFSFRARAGFTLVELLVVIGIIALLIAMLMPALARARQQAQWVACQSNMRQIGLYLEMYSNDWKGWAFPPRLGANRPRDQRWPVHVFKPAVWNPKVMLCPTDFEPAEEHSYLLNNHLADRGIKFSSKALGGLTASEVVLMGEKTSSFNDYYMNAEDYRRDRPGDFALGKVELYRHGLRLGSNYLYLDLHVGTFRRTDQFDRGVDPWDVPAGPT